MDIAARLSSMILLSIDYNVVLTNGRGKGIALSDLISLARLVAMTYPPKREVETFYNESERLVRFLAATETGQGAESAR